MNGFQRFLLGFNTIVIIVAILGSYVAYQNYVKPAIEFTKSIREVLELRDKVRKLESIIDRLPFKPFREDGEGDVGDARIEVTPLSEISDRELRSLHQRTYVELERRRQSRVGLRTAT